MTARSVCFLSSRLLPGVGACFDLMGTSERLLYTDHMRCMVEDHTHIERGKCVAC
jgi:hypothetical protein